MSEVTQLLNAMDGGDPRAAERLLPLVYEELRRLAARELSEEAANHTLQPTELVHEAYLRLVGSGPDSPWNGRGHFYGAAAKAMRRILIDRARRRQALRHGGGKRQLDLESHEPASPERSTDLLALDEALQRLADKDQVKAQLVELRYFAGLTLEEAAACLNISASTADRYWAYARAWLFRELASDENP
jgi:RNA polymerase sigma factor (TIGR02999 family)